MVAQTETQIVEGIGADYAVKYGFSNPDEAGDYFFLVRPASDRVARTKNETPRVAGLS